jgi:hypothetical protein
MKVDESKYIIVGAGSKLYNKLKKIDNKIIELSTIDALNSERIYDEKYVVIIFSLLDEDNLKKIKNKFHGTKIIVGSCAALSKLSNKFHYSRFKLMQLNFVKFHNDGFKYIIFGDFFPNKKKIGLYFYSNPDEFWLNCSIAALNSEKIHEAYLVTGNENFRSRILSSLDLYLSPISSWFIKKLSNYTYGYSNAKNSKYFNNDTV